MIDYDKLQRSLKRLELQVQNWRRAGDRLELNQVDREAIAESVIHRFETCYDTLWKTLKRYLTDETGLAETPSSPKPILKLAGQNQLLPSPVDRWLRYADARVSTAHDYSGQKAETCLARHRRLPARRDQAVRDHERVDLAMSGTLDITAAQLGLLLDLLQRYIPGAEVWAYGSRAKATARPNSDLDLVAFPTAGQSERVPELREALDESNLPFLVDIHVWNDLPAAFHDAIRKQYVIVQEGGARENLAATAPVHPWHLE